MDSRTWDNGETLAKPLANGDWAVLVFNRLNSTIDITLQLGDVGNTSQLCWDIRDIWNRTDLGRFNSLFAAQAVPPHGNRFLRLSNGSICSAAPPPPSQCDGHEPVNITIPASVHEDASGSNQTGARAAGAAASRGYMLRPQRGWYSTAGQQLVGEKGAMSAVACAAACAERGGEGGCAAFHVYFEPYRSCHLGDCYVHTSPLGAFVPGNVNSFAYNKVAEVARN